MDGQSYTHPDKLDRYILRDDRFVIKRDLWDDSHIYVFHANGVELCEAKRVVALPALGADREELSAAMSKLRTSQKRARTRIQEDSGRRRIGEPVTRALLAGDEVEENQDVLPAAVRAAEPRKKTKSKASKADVERLHRLLDM